MTGAGGFFHAPKLKRIGFYRSVDSLPGINPRIFDSITNRVTRKIANQGIDPNQFHWEPNFFWGVRTFTDDTGFVHLVED